jgi:hypothetical protein
MSEMATSMQAWMQTATPMPTVTPVQGDVGLGTWASTVSPNSGTLTMLQGGMTTAEMLSRMASGVMGFSQSQANASLQELNAKAETLSGEEKAVRIKREMVQKLGSARVAFAASGVDIRDGTPESIEGSIEQQARFETEMERSGAAVRAASARMRAAAYRERGLFDLVGGGIRAAQTKAGYGLDVARRG